MKNWYLLAWDRTYGVGVCVYGNILCATSCVCSHPNPKADLQLDVKYLLILQGNSGLKRQSWDLKSVWQKPTFPLLRCDHGRWYVRFSGPPHWEQNQNNTYDLIFMWITKRSQMWPLGVKILLFTRWDGWMASPTQWTWVWVNSGSWWWTGKPGMLQSMGSKRAGHNWVTELNWKIN